MQAFMLIICLFFSQLTYSSADEASKEAKHPVTVVATVPAQLRSIAPIDADERIRRLEKIANDLDERVKSLEVKVEDMDNLKKSDH